MPRMDPKDADRLVIGRFARLTGLSVGALRHYDELDLLRPAFVDRVTGYRSYRPDQLEAARTIVRLRDLEVPLETIRAYLGDGRPGRATPAARASIDAASRRGRSASRASSTSSASWPAAPTRRRPCP